MGKVTMERLVAALKAPEDHPDTFHGPFVGFMEDIEGTVILDGWFDLEKLARDLNAEDEE